MKSTKSKLAKTKKVTAKSLKPSRLSPTPKSSKLPSSSEDSLPAPIVETGGKSEALQAYIQSLKQYPLLSPEKENEIARKYFDSKDKAAAQLLILSNLRLVVKIAYDYLRSGFHVLDLIQEGNVGLMRAIQDYDPYRGVKFSSYASHWIKAYIRSFILSNWSLVKIGTTKAQRTLFYRLQKEKSKLEALGLPAGPKFLAERLDLKEKDVIDMSQRLKSKDVSLNAPLRSDEQDSDSLIQLLKDERTGADIQLAEDEIRREFSNRLDAFEKTLSGKELIVFRERLRSEEPKTLQEIGDIYQISRERIRQIEARVMEKLKDSIRGNPKLAENIIDLKSSKDS